MQTNRQNRQNRLNEFIELLKTESFITSLKLVVEPMSNINASKFLTSLKPLYTEIEELENHLLDNISEERKSYKKFSLSSYMVHYVKGTICKCKICGKYHLPFVQTCSKECQSKLDGPKEKRKKTNLERYGVENCYQSEEKKKKIRETNLERYGASCALHSTAVREKTKKTNLEKYGSEHPMRSDKVKQKVKDTCIERYGVENVMHNEEIKQKLRESILERYGVEYPLQSPEIKQKVKDTCIERYGVENVMQTEDIKERLKAACLEKYGYENVYQSPLIKEKIRKTNLERYGVENPLQSELIKEKIKATNLAKYGVLYTSGSNGLNDSCLIPRTYMQRNLKNTEELNSKGCQKFIKDGYFNIDEFAEYFNMSVSHAYKYKRYLGIETPCSDSGSSKAEKELSDFIQNVLDDLCAKHKIPKIEVKRNDRSVINPLELDIYIPELKLAVEYNGIYWHSLKDKYYHFNKSMLCYNKGIRLIHVYEEIDDISKVKDLLKTVITSKLSNDHLCVTQDYLKIDLSKDDPFIPGYSIKEILEPIQISENLYNAGYFVLQKNL